MAPPPVPALPPEPEPALPEVPPNAFELPATPEPLPADDPLWSLANAQITMHLSGRAQSKMFVRSAERFVENCRRYVAGEPLAPIFDPARGY